MMPQLEPGSVVAIPPTLTAALAIAISALTATVIYLFRYLMRQSDAASKDREKHASDRAQWESYRKDFESFEFKLRAEYESRHREVTNVHNEALVKMYEEARQTDRENRREYLMSLDETRRDYAANVDGVAKKYEDGTTKLGAVIDKLASRISGRARTH